MESQIFSLPSEMNRVISATIIDSVNGDILFCHDENYLYAAKITKVGGSVIFQRFSLQRLSKLIPIIKNYFIALFENSKLVVFEVWFNEENKVMLKYVFNKGQIPCYSYFLRQVVDNMAELHLLYQQNELYIHQFTINGKVGHMNYVLGPQNKIKAERKQLYGSKTIFCPHQKLFYYFTNFSNKNISSINLSKIQTEISKQYNTTPLTYICVPKIEEHFLILANLLVINITSPQQKHQIMVDGEYSEEVMKLLSWRDKSTFRISTYFDMVLIQDSQLMTAAIFHIKIKGSCLLAFQYGNFNWFWTSTKKLVGFSPSRNSFKMIENLKKNSKAVLEENSQQEKTEQESEPDLLARSSSNFYSPEQLQKIYWENKAKKQLEEKKQDFMKPKMGQVKYSNPSEKKLFDNKESFQQKTILDEELAEKQAQDKQSTQQVKVKEKQIEKMSQVPRQFVEKLDLPKKQSDKFVPKKVIQKKGVNVSKTINKPKDIEPIRERKSSKKEEIPEKVEEKPAIEEKKEVAPEQVKIQEKNTEKNAEVQQNQRESPKIEQMASIPAQNKPEQQKERIEEKQNLSVLQTSSIKPSKQEQNEVKQIKKEDSEPIKQEKTNPFMSLFNNTGLKIKDIKQTDSNNLFGTKKGIFDQPSFFGRINRDNIFASSSKLTNIWSQNSTEPKQGIYNPLLFHSPFPNRTQEKSDSKASETDQPFQNFLKKCEKMSKQEQPQENKEEKKIDEDRQRLNEQKIQEEVKKPEESVKYSENREKFKQDKQSKQQRNKQALDKIKELFKDTTLRLLKTLDEISESSSIAPYLKDKIISEIETSVLTTLKNSLTGSFATKIELFFKEIFKQSSEIQEESIKFYKEAASHKSSLIQTQLINQEKILKEVKQIENMIRVSIHGLRNENLEVSENLIREWSFEMRQTKKIVDNLEDVKNKMVEESEKREKRYEETKNQLEAIRKMLQDRVDEEEKKREKELEMEALRRQELAERKKKKAKKVQKRGQGERQKKVRIRKYVDV